jgi:hypothetical protein
MRRVVLALASCLVLGWSAAGRADQVVLKDGSVINTSKPYVLKGNQAILTLTDGTLVSVPANQIDGKKTAEANAKAAKPSKEKAVVAAPQSPAEAARMKSSRKASIVLSDEDVQHPIANPDGTTSASKGNGEGKVEVTNVQTSRESGTLMVTGSMQNTGEGDVVAVSVTVEAVGKDNKTVSTAFGRVAKDSLGSGEKTTFTAEFQEESSISNVRFVPRWQVKVPVSKAPEGAAAQPAAGPSQAPAAEQKPAAPEAKKDEIKYVPRGDVAPPPANPAVGAPTNPNAPYFPQPADVVPTQPPQK